MQILYMKEAIKEARKALKADEVPIGAVIVKDGKIIARAHNLTESKQNATYHAEVLAINKACKKLKSWLEERLQRDVSETLKPIYEKLLEFSSRAIELNTGVEIEL